MSYILEAIKKAESERGDTRLYENHNIASSQQATKQIPWVAIAIFINAAILLIWMGIQLFSNFNSEEKSSYEGLEEKYLQQQKEENHPQISNAAVVEKPPAVLAENNKVEMLNTEPETNNESVKVKPNFVNQSVNNELVTDESTHSKKTTARVKNILPAKVASLPNTENFISRDNEDQLVIDDAVNLKEPVMAPVKREILIVENSNVPSFNELPYALQQRIPDLVISVHIYNVVEAARKVRVNGRLLHQGDAVSDDLIVEEITSYGVIFNYSGELFKRTLR